MIALYLLLQVLVFIAFAFGFTNATKGVKMYTEDKNSISAYLMIIGGVLAAFSITMYYPIRLMGIILWAVGSVCCCIGAAWYDYTHEEKIYGQIIRIFTTVFVFVILDFFYNNIPYH